MIGSKTRLTLLHSSAVILALFLSSGAAHAENGSDKQVNLPKPNPRKETVQEVLSDLRDARLCLAQVKQQAVNVFMEATRTEMTPAEPALEHTPELISAKMINTKSKFVPPRKEWLVFYVNTLEPTIHLLCEDLKDVDANHERYPAEFSKVLRPMWAPWRDDVLSINKSLDEMQELIGQEQDTNVPLAKVALDIYTKVSDLEKVRYNAAKAVRDVVNKGKPAKKKK